MDTERVIEGIIKRDNREISQKEVDSVLRYWTDKMHSAYNRWQEIMNRKCNSDFAEEGLIQKLCESEKECSLLVKEFPDNKALQKLKEEMHIIFIENSHIPDVRKMVLKHEELENNNNNENPRLLEDGPRN